MVIPRGRQAVDEASTVARETKMNASERWVVETAGGQLVDDGDPAEDRLDEKQPQPGQAGPVDPGPLGRFLARQPGGQREDEHETACHQSVQVLPEDPSRHLRHHAAEAGRPVRTSQAGLGGVDDATEEQESQGPEHGDGEAPRGGGGVPGYRRRSSRPLRTRVSPRRRRSPAGARGAGTSAGPFSTFWR